MHIVSPTFLVSPPPMFLAGARQEAQYSASLIMDGEALNITVLRYSDGLDFGVVGDQSVRSGLAEPGQNQT